MNKKTPEVIEAIVAFINAYSNPYDEKGEARRFAIYQLNCYDVSYDFKFKWGIKQSEMDEILAWNKEFKLKDNVLLLSLGEHNVELAVSK